MSACRSTPSPGPTPGPVLGAMLAAPWLLLAAGCAVPARTIGAGPAGSDAGADSGVVVVSVNLRHSAEAADARGALRLFDRDLRVEYRAGGLGPGLEAGEVRLGETPLGREVGARGAVAYRRGPAEPPGGEVAGGNPWVTLSNTGGPRVSAASVRLKLAQFPLVTRPTPGQAVPRDEELAVVMLPPLPEVWYRVALAGAGDPVNAVDLGEGRWLFPRGSLAGLGPGRARIVIEAETSCGDCPGAGLMRASWWSRAELELPVTLL